MGRFEWRSKRVERLLLPKDRAASVVTINYAALASQGIEYVVFDYDNTLTGWQDPKIPARHVEALMAVKPLFKGYGILSNAYLPSRRRRVKAGADQIKAAWVACVIPGTLKPLKWPYLKILEELGDGATPQNTAMVGDQLGDIIGGNSAGMFTIMVDGYGEDHLTTLPSRWLEQLLRGQEARASRSNA